MDNFSQLAKAYHASIKALANAETAYQRHRGLAGNRAKSSKKPLSELFLKRKFLGR